MWEWIKAVDSRIPQPDMTIVLHVPTKVSKKISANKEQKNELMGKNQVDIHEADPEYQEKVRKTYLEIAEREGWIVIDCSNEKDGVPSLIPPEEIHDEVYRKLKEKNVF